MSKKKIVSKELLFPFIAVTFIFALWGFANDVTNPMVAAFKKVMDLSNSEAYYVQFAFYFGYGVMAIPAALFIRQFNYKSGLLVGLFLYAVGAFLFFPAATLESYNFFLISLFVITCGLGFLETSANPLILSMGDPDTATQRLNLAQSFNPIGSLSGMVVAKFVVLDRLLSKNYENSAAISQLGETQAAAIKTNDLNVISTPYLAIGIFVAIVFFIILLKKIPSQSMGKHISIGEAVNKIFKNKIYLLGVIAQIFYVGAQIMCWTAIFQLVEYLNYGVEKDSQIDATWWNIAAMVLFVSTRFFGTSLMSRFKPAMMLFVFGTCGVVSSAGVILFGGFASLICLVLTSVFMSIMFPTIYGLALYKMGEEAKLASAGLIMAIVGGGLMPQLQARIMDFGEKTFGDTIAGIPEIQFSFILPLICLLVVALYGLYTFKVRKNQH